MGGEGAREGFVLGGEDGAQVEQHAAFFDSGDNGWVEGAQPGRKLVGAEVAVGEGRKSKG